MPTGGGGYKDGARGGAQSMVPVQPAGGSRFNLLDSSSQPHSSTDVDSVSTQLPHDSDGSLFKGMSYQPVSRASVF